MEKSCNCVFEFLWEPCIGECLLSSSLPCKALKIHFEFLGSAEQFNIRYQSHSGKFDIKRCKPGILFIKIPLGSISLFKLVIII